MRQLLSVTTEESPGTRIVHRGLKLCSESEISSAQHPLRERRRREAERERATERGEEGRKDVEVREGRIVHSLCKTLLRISGLLLALVQIEGGR